MPALAVEPVEIAAERAGDASAVERVLDRAFGPGRFAKVSERVRERIARARPDLSFVARRGGSVVGCCRIHDASVAGAPVKFLGPLAVDPAEQGEGLGHRLVAAALEACRAEGHAVAVILVGAPAFFTPFGFVRVPSGRVTLPGPVEARRLQWLFLRDGAEIAGALARPG